MILSRGLGYYTELLVSAVLTIVANFTIGRREKSVSREMLGIYDYTVVLTYVSLMVSIGGMMLSVNGHLNRMARALSGNFRIV